METHTLYRFWNASDALLYVGITADPLARWKRHKDEKPWWHDVARVTIEHFGSREDVDTAETLAIQTESPQYNVAKRRLRVKATRPRRRAPMQITAAGQSAGTSATLYAGEFMAVVADGLADRPGGCAASATVVETFAGRDVAVRPKKLVSTLLPAVEESDAAVRARAKGNPELEGMASSFVAMMWSGEQVVTVSVGNSRIFRVRRGQIEPLTDPHTYDHLVSGARQVPGLAGRLTRFAGGHAFERTCSPDTMVWDLRPGDRYLLCSDGLSSYVPQTEIEGTMAVVDDLDALAEQLVGLALDQGGHDNVTVVVVDVR